MYLRPGKSKQANL